MSLPYLTSNAFVNFPFTENSVRRSNEGPEIPINFLVDAIIDSTYAVEGAYIKSITPGSTGPGNFLDFEIAGLDTTQLVVIRILKSQYAFKAIFGAYNPTTKVVSRVVIGTYDFDTFFTAVGAGLTFSVAATTFSSHVFSRSASKVLRFRMSPDVGVTWNPYRQQIPLTVKEGFNISLTPAVLADGTQQVTIAALPGSGMGVYNPGSSITPAVGYLAKLGDATPDDYGNVVIKGDECYRTVLNPANRNAVTLVNDCKCCCSCTDYENVASNLAYIQDINDQLKGKALGLGGSMGSAAGQWNSDLINEVKRRKMYAYCTIEPQDTTGTAYWVTLVLLNNLFDLIGTNPPVPTPATQTPSVTIVIPTQYLVQTTSRVNRTYEDPRDKTKYISDSTLYSNQSLPNNLVFTGNNGIYLFPSISAKNYGILKFQITASGTPPSGIQQIAFTNTEPYIDLISEFKVP
jgi:hypothetical protein